MDSMSQYLCFFNYVFYPMAIDFVMVDTVVTLLATDPSLVSDTHLDLVT